MLHVFFPFWPETTRFATGRLMKTNVIVRHGHTILNTPTILISFLKEKRTILTLDAYK